MSLQKRKVEIIIDNCLGCPYVQLTDVSKEDWQCGKNYSMLKKNKSGWLDIPSNCPLDKVDEPFYNQQQFTTPSEEPLQSGVDTV